MSVVGSIVAGATFFSFYNGRLYPILIVGFSWTIANYVLLFIVSTIWLMSREKNYLYEKFARSLQAVQVSLGLSWGAVVVTGVYFGNTQQRAFTYALSIALISTSMVSGPAKYALSFWFPVTTLSFFALVFDQGHFYLPIFVALLCYGFLSFYSILSTNKDIQEREHSAYLVDAHSQTIELMLKDFQEGHGSFLWESAPDGKLVGLPNYCILQEAMTGKEPISLEKILEILQGDCNEVESRSVSHLRAALVAHETFKDIRVRMQYGGRRHIWSIAGKPVFDEGGGFAGFRGLCTDVTEKEEYRRRIEFAASHDYLTETYNRSTFLEFLNQIALSENIRQSALLCIDLDQFKSVNDNFGHAVGDELLRAVVKRIVTCVRAEDRVFRLGGDEFAVAIPGGDEAQATAVAERIIERVCKAFRVGDATIRVGASIGIALIDADGSSGEAAHKRADLALYRAKSSGRGTFCFADDALDEPLEHALAMQQALSLALERSEMRVAYQPIVELSSGKVVAVEALLRWTHPTYGAVPPDVFIGLLEQSGKIGPVGDFVMAEALRTAARVGNGVRFAINLSPRQLADSEFPRRIDDQLRSHGVDAQFVEFEITETGLLDGDAQRQAVLHAIKRLGCRISLDDFGTGHSSLRLLDEFPFDKMKIDASFVNQEDAHSRRPHILHSMIRLGRELGLTVTGEGIETEAQADRLLSLGCDEGQGFFFFKPMSSESLLSVLQRDGKALVAACCPVTPSESGSATR